MVNQQGSSYKYGVGKYILEMIREASQNKDRYTFIVLTIGEGNKVSLKNKGNVTYFNIPAPFQTETPSALLQEYSRSVFYLLLDYFSFRETDIFHFNSNILYHLLQLVREKTPAKLLYTAHVSLWKVFYNNDKQAFLKDWNDPDNETLHKLDILAEKKSCELADKVICLTKGMKDDIINLYRITPSKIFKIHNGISLNGMAGMGNELRNMLKFQSDDFVFLYVGRLRKQKGVGFLLNAFIQLIEKGKGKVRLVVVGDGPYRRECDELCKGYENAIKLIGYVSSKKIGCYYQMANGMVLPSLNEQSSYVMLEAMAHKVPMVASDIPGFSILENGKHCLKVALENENEISSTELLLKMIRIKNDDTLRKELAENAYELYQEKLTAKTMFVKTYKYLP